MTTETNFAQLLGEALYEAGDDRVLSVRTFGEAMLMTDNNGLVVRLTDGTEFQLTVVQSA